MTFKWKSIVCVQTLMYTLCISSIVIGSDWTLDKSLVIKDLHCICIVWERKVIDANSIFGYIPPRQMENRLAVFAYFLRFGHKRVCYSAHSNLAQKGWNCEKILFFVQQLHYVSSFGFLRSGIG